MKAIIYGGPNYLKVCRKTVINGEKGVDNPGEHI